MKTLQLLFLTEILVSLTSFSQSGTIIRPDYANIATLIVDFDTYGFEGGNIAYYTCPECTNDSIPLVVDYHPPGDFGQITFTLASTSDTIFDATIIWMGTGQIDYPEEFITIDPFSFESTPVVKPSDIMYLDMEGNISDDPWITEKADSAWDVVDSLVITRYFSEYNYKVAIYLYPPSVGAFDPQAAKWIVFLYHYETPNSIETDYSEMGNTVFYPNPVRDILFINDNKLQSNIHRYRIYSVIGTVMIEGIIKNNNYQIDVSSFPNGIYFIEFLDKSGYCFTTEKLIKE